MCEGALAGHAALCHSMQHIGRCLGFQGSARSPASEALRELVSSAPCQTNQMSSKSDELGSGYLKAGRQSLTKKPRLAPGLCQGSSLLIVVVGAAVVHFVLHLLLLEFVPALS